MSAYDYFSGVIPADGISKVAAKRLFDRTDVILPAPAALTLPLFPIASILASDRHLWSADYLPSDGYRLLYLRRGSGSLQREGRCTSLTENSIFLFPLTSRYHLTLEAPVWELRSLLLSGPSADYYYQLFSQLSDKPVTLPDASPLALQWKPFHSELPTLQADPLLLIEKLTQLMHTAIKAVQASCAVPASIPKYLLDIRENFHIDCSRPYSLDDLEMYYHVSKYRIVREFRQAFGTTPIAYLNQLRLQKAYDLLFTETLSIRKIASLVGFENSSHFINLFQKQYHITPGACRKLRQNTHPQQ